MSDQDSWHGEDSFWELFEPILFDQQRLANAKEEIDQLISLLQIQQDDHVLDLSCGTGRHSLELARRGFDVVGVDRTASFIEKARAKAEEEDLRVEFVVGDMRDYRQPATFDVVINLFGSFGYFDDPIDNRRVIMNMLASLRPRGRFVIETAGKEIMLRGFREMDWSEAGDTLVLAERKPIQSWGRIQTRWIVIKGDRRTEHTVSVRSYTAVELSSLVSDCGFENVSIYGGLDGRDYDLVAERLVVVGFK